MTKFGLAVINIPDASVRLDQFCQVTYVPYETKRKFSCGPDATPPFDLKLFVELV